MKFFVHPKLPEHVRLLQRLEHRSLDRLRKIRNAYTSVVEADFHRITAGFDRNALQGFVCRNADLAGNTTVYTDDNPVYPGLLNHWSVNHSRGQYGLGEIHTNGIEVFWTLLKRSYHGTYHWWSRKHLQRYLNEFAGRHHTRPLNTIAQMVRTAAGLEGKRLRYAELVA